MRQRSSNGQWSRQRVDRVALRFVVLVALLVGLSNFGLSNARLSCGPFDLAAAHADEGGDKGSDGKTEKKKEEPKRSVDASLVYFGTATAKWKTPAELDLTTVYDQIEEFKTLRKDGLEPSDARYAILMTKVSRKFQKALKKAAKAGGYDLIAALGAVQGVSDVPNVSQSVIDQL